MILNKFKSQEALPDHLVGLIEEGIMWGIEFYLGIGKSWISIVKQEDNLGDIIRLVILKVILECEESNWFPNTSKYFKLPLNISQIYFLFITTAIHFVQTLQFFLWLL